MKSVLDSRQLLAARVLAETGSFTLAGQQLSLTQSAVSHTIKALEEEVECQLFLRTGKGVKVTPAGRHFLKSVDLILAQMETTRTLVSPRTSHGKERLRLGVGTRARACFLPVVLPAFQRQFPHRLVVLELGDYRRNLELLESGLLDLAFTVRPMGPQSFGYVHLFEDELRFIVAPSHPWARNGWASLDDLHGDMLLLLQQFNNSAGLLGTHLQAEQITPRHVVELPDYKPIKSLVATGLAVAVLPPWLLADELRDGSLVSLPIGPHPLIRQWGLASQPNRSLSPMEKTFVQLCQQAVPGIISRLRGLAEESFEKKAPRRPETEPADARYGGIALALIAAFNLWADVVAPAMLAVG